MPELPEVETVVRTLEGMLQGGRIQKAEVRWDRLIDNMSAADFERSLQGQAFRSFSRRGKYLLFTLDRGTWISHMRMEGKYYVTRDPSLMDRHTHLVLYLEDGRMVLYHDTRKFGRMEYYPQGAEWEVLRGLGLEPSDPALTEAYLREKVSPNRRLKEVLLDQSVIAGIGNIYADEICFAVGRRPSTRFGRLSRKEREDLIEKTRRILAQAVQAGGTTIRSYTSQLGVTGRFQQEVMVHAREDEPCRVCGTKIRRTRLAGRGTYYCPRCQK